MSEALIPSTIILKNSTISGKVPGKDDLVVGELALTLAGGEETLWAKNVLEEVINLRSPRHDLMWGDLLLKFDTLSDFLLATSAGGIKDTSVCFIAETSEIYCGGVRYSISEDSITSMSSSAVIALPGGLLDIDGSESSDELSQIFSTKWSDILSAIQDGSHYVAGASNGSDIILIDIKITSDSEIIFTWTSGVYRITKIISYSVSNDQTEWQAEVEILEFVTWATLEDKFATKEELENYVTKSELENEISGLVADEISEIVEELVTAEVSSVVEELVAAEISEVSDKVDVIYEGNTPLVSPVISGEWSFQDSSGNNITSLSSSASPIVEKGYKASFTGTYLWNSASDSKDPTDTGEGSNWSDLPATGTPSEEYTLDFTSSNTTVKAVIQAPRTGLTVADDMSISVAGGYDTTSDSVSVTFRDRRYYGYCTSKVPVESEIKSLTTTLTSSRSLSVSGISPDVSEYYVYAYPTSLGTLSSITQDDANAILAAFTQGTIDITNGAGATISYYYYVTNFPGVFTGAKVAFA